MVSGTGVTGAACWPLCLPGGSTSPTRWRRGLAIGACSHALGTTKALEIGELQGAMSSIAICVCGIFTSLIALFL
ncbi:MAG: LrgB family protein [Oscillospiraceae bacterium]